jgi:hypothetical protein
MTRGWPIRLSIAIKLGPNIFNRISPDTVAERNHSPNRSEDMRVEGLFSCKQASRFRPGGGNSNTAPFAIYGKGLSLKTSDRMHLTLHRELKIL